MEIIVDHNGPFKNICIQCGCVTYRKMKRKSIMCLDCSEIRNKKNHSNYYENIFKTRRIEDTLGTFSIPCSICGVVIRRNRVKENVKCLACQKKLNRDKQREKYTPVKRKLNAKEKRILQDIENEYRSMLYELFDHTRLYNKGVYSFEFYNKGFEYFWKLYLSHEKKKLSTHLPLQ